MSIFNIFRSTRAKSAETARDRLQIILAHERATTQDELDFLPRMQQDLLEVIRKYIDIDDEMVQVHLEKDDNVSALEVNIELPLDAPRKDR